RSVISGNDEVQLAPYESLCLRKVVPTDGKPYLLGASGHIYPGAQIEEVKIGKDAVTLIMDREAAAETRVFFGVPPGETVLCVNGIDYRACLQENMHYVVVKPELGKELPPERDRGEMELPPSLPHRKPGRPAVRKLYRKGRGRWRE
ncbi:MAG: hypothetical protein GX887_01860, partial [Firmicutes bacterium]|nr:hypothetical protein [Bacillota bacterium]